jgi:molybdate transport system ATP-binding protein
MNLSVDIEIVRGATPMAFRFEAPLPGIVALFGRSGAGKSSLLAALAGLVRPTRGRIALGDTLLFDSERGIDVPTEKRRLGFVFQEPRLFPHFTVRGNLLYGRRRLPATERPAVAPLVELLGLETLLDRRPATLSGGERSRVAIGRALLMRPRALLMDEPLANLDEPRRRELLRYIERLRDALELPIVYVSHAMEEVARLADTLVVVENGAVAAAGDIVALSADPAISERFGAFERGAVLRARILAHDAARGLTRLGFPGGEILAPLIESEAVGHELRVRILARDLILARSFPPDLSLHNGWRARILELHPQGAHGCLVALAIGESRLLARVTRDAVERLALEPGAEIFALCKAVALEAT